MKKKVKNIFAKIKESLFFLTISLSIVVSVILLTNILYQTKTVIIRGYEIKLSADGKPIIKVEKEVPFEELMALADVNRGKKIFKKCASCHNVKKEDGHKVGPNLYKILGRAQGRAVGFEYSDAMKAMNNKWTKQAINGFIKKPNEYLVGTKMAFAGLKKAQQRADVIKYLESLDQ